MNEHDFLQPQNEAIVSGGEDGRISLWSEPQSEHQQESEDMVLEEIESPATSSGRRKRGHDSLVAGKKQKEIVVCSKYLISRSRQPNLCSLHRWVRRGSTRNDIDRQCGVTQRFLRST